MLRLKTFDDVMNQVAGTLGEYVNDFDVESIANNAYRWDCDTDEFGNELLNTAGFECFVDADEYWRIVSFYDRTV